MSIEEEFFSETTKEHPMKILRRSAEALGIVLNPPKKNCKRCYGRGWLGINSKTGEPIPCQCIIPKMEDEDVGEVEYKPRNRAERRAKNKDKK